MFLYILKWILLVFVKLDIDAKFAQRHEGGQFSKSELSSIPLGLLLG